MAFSSFSFQFLSLTSYVRLYVYPSQGWAQARKRLCGWWRTGGKREREGNVHIFGNQVSLLRDWVGIGLPRVRVVETFPRRLDSISPTRGAEFCDAGTKLPVNSHTIGASAIDGPLTICLLCKGGMSKGRTTKVKGRGIQTDRRVDGNGYLSDFL